MSYPNADDYIEAVQSPSEVFRVPALRRAVFDLHPSWGIPVPASGNAAVVFKANIEGRDAALRFFIREDASSRERYGALGRHFADRGLEDSVAHPVWIDDAITVNGRTWPMVRMSWVDGRTLDAYVAHLAQAQNTEALAELSRIWRGLVDRLQTADFAHGDLQHGNVLIDSASTLRLVDFDGSWIPEFQGGRPPHETGHPNYQPTSREWGRWMDTFPGLVIYTALLALSRRPTAWETFQNGENLLFSADDFVPPFRTQTWELLGSLRDPEVDQAADRLMRVCQTAGRTHQTLESLMGERPRVDLRGEPSAPAPLYAPPVIPSQTGTRWWEQSAATSGAASQAGPAPVPGAGSARTGAQSSAGRPMPPPPPKPNAGVPMPPPPPKPNAGVPMPPPPPKSTPGPTSGPTPIFGGPRTGTWYPQPPSGPPGAPRRPGGPPPTPTRPTRGASRQRSPLVGILLVVLVAVSLVAVASNPPVGIIIALVSAIIAAAVLSNKT